MKCILYVIAVHIPLMFHLQVWCCLCYTDYVSSWCNLTIHKVIWFIWPTFQNSSRQPLYEYFQLVCSATH